MRIKRIKVQKRGDQVLIRTFAYAASGAERVVGVVRKDAKGFDKASLDLADLKTLGIAPEQD